MTISLIDTHCHVDLSRFDVDREAVLQRAVEAKVAKIIVPAIMAAHWSTLASLTQHYPNVFAAYGLHPMFMSHHHQQDIDTLVPYLQAETTIAVGECGLDFFIFDKQSDNEAAKKAQIALFYAQLSLAQQYNLPVIIHSRKSLDLVLKALRLYPDLCGVIHSFSGSQQQAYQLIDQGFYLGFGGVITYPRAKKLRYLVSTLPLDALLLETDAPDQPDIEHYGQRNEPAFLMNIAQVVADLRDISVQAVAQITTQNATELFKV